MDKKQILVSGIMGGVLLFIVPAIFLKSEIILTFLKGVGILSMAGGIIFFIAGDKLLNKGGPTGNFSKNIKQRIKNGEITPEEAFEKQKELYKQELELAKSQLLLEKQKALIEKERAAAKIHKAGPTANGNALGGKKKMPDVLGNLGSLMGGSDPNTETNSKKDNDLRNLF